MLQSNRVRAEQLLTLCSRAHGPQLMKSASLESVLSNKRSHCNEKPKLCKEEEPSIAATRGKPV